MKVLKFSGTSVGSTESIRLVKEIIATQTEPCVVVVSALGGVSDMINKLAKLASENDPSFKELLIEFRNRHFDIINDLLTKEDREFTLKESDSLINEFQDILQGVYLLQDLSDKTLDYLLAFGERLSAQIISKFVPEADYLDARTMILTDSNHTNANVNFNESNQRILQKLENLQKVAIVPGHIAADAEGRTTTLGREGSDYTAAIIAAATKSSVLELWTDVDGFMTSDPRIVEKAYPIECMTYEEAMELSHFGAYVLYTPTLGPVFKERIPIRIKNTFNPEAIGTLISDQSLCKSSHMIKGISSINEIEMITVKGAGMVGKTGTSMRIFSALARYDVNIVIIIQASSEMTISFAVSPEDTDKAVDAVMEEFEYEIRIKKEMEIEVLKDLSIIAIVGEEMRNTPGVSSILFHSLARNGISVIATTQGPSELNISVVINHCSLKKALNVVNEGFFLDEMREMHLYIAGIGNVGSKLLKQLQQQRDKLMESHRLKINLVGITNSRKMLLDEKGIDLEDPIAEIEKGEPANIDSFIDSIRQNNLRNSVFVDCTALDEPAEKYLTLFEDYVSVITANKVACSSEYSLYKSLKDTSLVKGVTFSFETNVGAGLPVISTIEDLISSGDKILELEAVVSGTLNYILNVLSEEIPLSKAIQMAKENGYSEPDPRLDLSGVDVKRKLLILSRESGYVMEEDGVDIEPFLPKEMFEGSEDEFWKKVSTLDNEWEKRRKKLATSGKRLRYVASLKDGKGKTGLMELDETHPAYRLEASNNIILFTTERYREQPLIIQGYGAGAEVTAAGVFADVIRAGTAQ